MTKDNGSLNLRGEVTPLMEVFLRRRSSRRYGEGRASPQDVDHILACVKQFEEASGFDGTRISIVEEGPEFDTVLKAAASGLIGKINAWLPSTRARHLILAGAVYREDADRATKELAIKQTAMAMQVAILAATELGLATCWMAGINHERVEEAHPLSDSARLIAMSTLGVPAERKGLSWDALSYHMISKRRKPLDELWMAERWREI